MTRGRAIAFAVVLVVLGVSAVGMGTAIRAFGFHLRKMPIDPPGGRVLSSMPRETVQWEAFGSDRTESAETVEVLGTENYVNRLYKKRGTQEGEPVLLLDFHAAYYTGMIDTVPHVPERCFVGGGLRQAEFAEIVPVPMDEDWMRTNWVPDASVPEDMREQLGDVYTVRLGYEHSSAPGKRVRLPLGISPESPIMMRVSSFEGASNRKLYAGYFFIANGGTVANAQAVRTLAFDLTSDYAYYTKVQFTSQSAESPEQFAEMVGSLLQELIGEIMLCVPDWVEVQSGNYPEDNPRGQRGATES